VTRRAFGIRLHLRDLDAHSSMSRAARLLFRDARARIRGPGLRAVSIGLAVFVIGLIVDIAEMRRIGPSAVASRN
jgi:hypothetical protein